MTIKLVLSNSLL